MKKITLLFTFFTISFCFPQDVLLGTGKADSTFEDHSAGGLDVTAALSGNGTNWNSSGGDTTIEDDALQSYEGDKYINMANGFKNVRRYFTATPNTDYTLTFYYRHSFDGVDVIDRPNLQINVDNGSNNGSPGLIPNTRVPIAYTSDLKDYTKFTQEFTTTAGTAYTLFIFKEENGATNSAIRFDNFSIVPTSSLSTNDNLKAFNFKYFPNPVKDKINLTAFKQIDNVQIYNLLGQEVLRTSPLNRKSEIDISSLKAGILMVKVTIEGVSDTYKIVKN